MSPVEAAVLIVVAAAIATYATAIGTGGGFLIAPLLLVRYPDVEPAFVTAASLSVVAISTVTSSVFVTRERRVDYHLVGAIAVVAVPAAMLGAAGTAILPRTLFAIGFAALLAALAAYLVWRPQAGTVAPVRRAWRRRLVDREGDTFEYRIPVLRSVLPVLGMSFVAALVGIGGGSIDVPVLTRVMRVPHAIAVPSVQVLIALMTISAVGLHLATGHAGDPFNDVPWLGLGVAAGNPLAQRLRRRGGEGRLTRLLALGLVIVAVQTAVRAL